MNWTSETNIKGPAGPPGGISEAPTDGQIYGRQNAAWNVVVSGGGGGAASGITVTPAGNIASTNVQAALQELDTEKVAKAGDTMTGNLLINKANPSLVLQKLATGQANQLAGYNGANPRWSLALGDNTAEGGSNAGSNFALYRYTDAGGLIDTPLTINRVNGGVTLTGALVLAADPGVALGAATKQYVDNAVRAPATATPLVEAGAGAVGASLKYAREDHVHPAAGSGAAAVTATTLNPADKDTHITLSGGNLTATGTAGWTGLARAVDAKSAGKFYWETTFNATQSQSGVGLAIGSLPVNSTFSGSVASGKCGLVQIGNVFVDGSATLTVGGVPASSVSFGTITSGTVICVAVDLTAKLAWWRLGAGGNWNNNASYNPATGVGGVSIPNAGIAYPTDCFGGADTLISNFGATTFLGTAPAGFVAGWPVADGTVHYDFAQALTANQKAQARANIDVLKKNYIVNGAMMISQENGTTAGTAVGYYPVDGFVVYYGNAGTQTFQQVAGITPGGSPNRLRVTATVADAAVAAGDVCFVYQPIEGLRVADLRAGSTSAKTVTIQFGVHAPAGTYCVAVRNAASDRSYVAEYVITTGEANNDVIKSVTLLLDTLITATWPTGNTAGIVVSWGLMAGATYQTPAGSWVAGNFVGSSNQFNFMGTVNNTFELFDVSLTEGNVAPPFVVPDYVSELALCKRYWAIAYGTGRFPSVAGGNVMETPLNFPVEMRSMPIMTVGTPLAVGNATPTAASANTISARFFVNSIAAGDSFASMTPVKLNARL
jgi:hypothetical protein